MTSFWLPACATWEHGGGTWHVYLDVGKERQPQTVWRGSRRSITACWAWPAHQEGQTLHLLQQPWAPARARGENSKPNRKIRPKVNRGLTTGACWAPWRFTGIGELLHCMLDPSLGVCVGLEGEHVRGGSTPGRQKMGSQKWMGATRQEHAEPHGQFTMIDDFIARETSTEGPCGRHRGRQHTSYWFWRGGIELYAGV
jgi:hypothetical protein